jgi:hypothetical protein
MRIAVVTGSRELEHHGTVEGPLLDFAPDLVMHGDCPTGADRYAGQFASLWDLPFLPFPADWKKHGKSAGPIRNRDMIQNAATLARYGHEVVVFAFPRGPSPGTRNCVREAVRAGLRVVEL